jgi:hypothetical protein
MHSLKARPEALYFVTCLSFWVVAVLSPIKWASRFLQIDFDHIYNHVFFALLFLVGSLIMAPRQRSALKTLVVGVIAGWISSALSLLAVNMHRSNGIEVFVRATKDWQDLLYGYVFFPSVVLMGSVWGAFAACIVYWAVRRLSLRPSG